MMLAITNAVAPMTGGISVPPVEAQVSTPAAKVPRMPIRFMAGMVIEPVVSTLVMTLPLIDPMSPLEKIETLAGPPLTLPRSANERSIKNAPAPVCCRAAPKIRKPMIRPAKVRMGMPRMLSEPMA